MYCARCGGKTDESAIYCRNCGARRRLLDTIGRFVAPRDAAAGIHYGALFTVTLVMLVLFYGVVFVLHAIGGKVVEAFLGLVLGSFFAYLPLVVFLPLILWLDRFEPEPPKLLMIAFFGGGILSTLLALSLEMVAGLALGMVLPPDIYRIANASVVAPLAEEPAKALVVLAIFLLFREEFDGPIDGIVYGALAGLGFEAFENLIYIAAAFEKAGAAGMLVVFGLRWFLSPLSHAVFTGAFGLALGLTVSMKSPAAKVATALAGLGCGIFLHFCWNFTSTVSGSPLSVIFLDIFLLMPSFVLFGLAVYLALRREAQMISSMLEEETGGGVITPAELAALSSVQSRMRKGYAILSRHGFSRWREYRVLLHAQTKLAFLKYQASLQSPPRQGLLDKIVIQRRFIEGYRAHLIDSGLEDAFGLPTPPGVPRP